MRGMRPATLAQAQAEHKAQAAQPSLTLCISLVTGALGKDTQSPFTGEEMEALAEQARWWQTGTEIDICPSHHLASIMWLREGHGWPCSNATL